MKTVKIKVEGMSCMHCVASVRGALEKVVGVKEVEVSLADGMATVTAADGVQNDALVAAVYDMGFGAALA